MEGGIEKIYKDKIFSHETLEGQLVQRLVVHSPYTHPNAYKHIASQHNLTNHYTSQHVATQHDTLTRLIIDQGPDLGTYTIKLFTAVIVSVMLCLSRSDTSALV
jgi:hypothetical protein